VGIAHPTAGVQCQLANNINYGHLRASFHSCFLASSAASLVASLTGFGAASTKSFASTQTGQSPHHLRMAIFLSAGTSSESRQIQFALLLLQPEPAAPGPAIIIMPQLLH